MNGSSPGVSGNITYRPLYASTIDLKQVQEQLQDQSIDCEWHHLKRWRSRWNKRFWNIYTYAKHRGTVLLSSGAGLTIETKLKGSKRPYNIVTTLNGSSPGVAGDIAV